MEKTKQPKKLETIQPDSKQISPVAPSFKKSLFTIVFIILLFAIAMASAVYIKPFLFR